MVRTIQILGSDEVLAMFGKPGIFYVGKWEGVQIIKTSKDCDVPLAIRKGLVGLTIPTIFTKESIEKQIKTKLPFTKNTRLAYCTDIIQTLQLSGKTNEATQLIEIAKDPLDMYSIEPDIYQLPSSNSLINKFPDDFDNQKHPFKKDGGFVHPYLKN